MKKIIILLVLGAFFFIGCNEIPEDIDPKNIIFKTGNVENEWVSVEKGEFLAGMHNHEKVVNYDYEIMAAEVTYLQYAKYLNEALAAEKITIEDGFVKGFYKGDPFYKGRHELELKPKDYIYYNLNGVKCRMIFENGVFTVKEGFEKFPVGYASWFGANAYAEFYGYKLATLKEWEKAARGTDGNVFPWGFEEPTTEMANFHHSKDPFDEENAATPVAFYNGQKHGDFQTKDNRSVYGCYDMAGNVAEWIGELQHGSHLRLIYGGSFMEYGYNLRLFTENSAIPEYCSFQVGFRCTRTAEGVHIEEDSDKVLH
jgi:formylglycine-generating enzyme